jgi:hypothetical protein
LRAVLLALTVGLLVLGCGASASFQPEGACVADGRATGLYPDLEALLPREPVDAGSMTVDSGRNCSDDRLGTLKSHGLTDLRFAGVTSTLDAGYSSVIAVFRAGPGQPALQPEWMDEFYETSARATTKTENIEISHPTYELAGEVYELSTLNDLSYQTVVVWPGAHVIHVVIVATPVRPGGLTRADHDKAVRDAVLTAAKAAAA